MLHVLNGDATLRVFERAGIPGETLVWRDILVEGPPATAAARADYLAERFGIDAAEYIRGREAEAAALDAARAHDEITLWFEQDLFCTVNLWGLLERLAPDAGTSSRLSLVFPSTGARRGLGTLEPHELPPLFADRRSLAPAALALGRRAWAAYAGPDPRALEPLIPLGAPALPFVGRAARLHLGRFPSAGNGVNEIEEEILLALVGGPLGFATLFRALGASERVRPHGLGDVQCTGYLRELAAGGLLTLDGPPDDPAHWRLSIEPRGRDVLACHADWLAAHSLNRWLGGVHLGPGRTSWRWHARQHRLLPN